MISDRDVLRRTLGSSMLRNIYIKQTRILLSKKVINLFQQSEQGELIMYAVIHCRSGPPVSSPWLSFEDSFFDMLPNLSTQISSEPELLLVFVLLYFIKYYLLCVFLPIICCYYYKDIATIDLAN